MLLSCSCPLSVLPPRLSRHDHFHLRRQDLFPRLYTMDPCKSFPQLAPVFTSVDGENEHKTIEKKPLFKWTRIGPDITEDQKRAIYRLPKKMTNRCKAVMKQIICFSPQAFRLSHILGRWVRVMKPRRADWLAVLKQLRITNHPLHIEVLELALLEESFEPNVRDYTKLIDLYGQQKRIQDVEKTLTALKENGFICDQVILTTMIHIYSKSGHLHLAEEAFDEIKLMSQSMDKRSYGSLITAYIRAGLLDQGESLLREMHDSEIYAGPEVYKALLRAYSMAGNVKAAQRVFDLIQLAGITPDAKLCALLINACRIKGLAGEARIVFENMRKAGIEASDKCVSLMLEVYEKENRLDNALEFLIELEGSGIVVGEEGSEVLARWFRRIGVVEEVELLLRDFVGEEGAQFKD